MIRRNQIFSDHPTDNNSAARLRIFTDRPPTISLKNGDLRILSFFTGFSSTLDRHRHQIVSYLHDLLLTWRTVLHAFRSWSGFSILFSLRCCESDQNFDQLIFETVKNAHRTDRPSSERRTSTVSFDSSTDGPLFSEEGG